MRSEHVDSDGKVIVRDSDGVVRETVALTDKDLRESYDRGRRDEAGRHKRNWLVTLLTTLLALVGALVLVMAALNGSFQRGGAVIDRQLSIAADNAEPAVRNAASEVSEEIQEARTPEVPLNDPEIPVMDPNDPSVVAPNANSTVVQTPNGQTTTTTTTTEAR
jgi:Tfp pilus assembly protein PilX